MDNADALTYYLNQAGINVVFGVPGGAIEPFYNSIARTQRSDEYNVRQIVARHETGAALMAEGYYRETGKVAVCCTTSGPGASNAVTGVSSAFAESIPMIVITGCSSIKTQGKGALQEGSDTFMNTLKLFDNCTVYNTMVTDSNQFTHKVIAAINHALTKSKPVHLSIPVDILREPVTYGPRNFSFTPLRCDHVTSEVVSVIQDNVRNKRVTLLLGKGAAPALDLILEAASYNNWLIAVTPDGKGLVPAYTRNYVGVFGFAGHQSATSALRKENCDCVLAIGVTMNEVSTSGWDDSLQLNHNLVQIDELESRLMASTFNGVQVLGSLRDMFSTLTRIWKIRHPKPENIAALAYDDVKKTANVHVTELLSFLDANLPSNYRLYADSGCSYLWSIHYAKDRVPDNNTNLFNIGIGTSTMAWAIGAAVGAATGLQENSDNDTPIVCLTGDGSYLMSGHELSTAVAEGLNVIFIVLNDSCLGMVKHGQQLAKAERIGTHIPEINFADMAKSLGVSSVKVHDTTGLETVALPLLKENRTGRPILIDISVDREAVPPMGSRMKVLSGE